eukprot:g3104.t1
MSGPKLSAPAQKLHRTPYRLTDLDIGGAWRCTGTVHEVARATGQSATAEDKLMMMLLSGADCTRRNSYKETPLHWAMKVDTVNKIVDLGGLETIDAVDERGQTPLHWAARHGHTEKAKRLLRLGASALLKDSAKRTPFEEAKEHDNFEIAEILKWAMRRQNNGMNIPKGGLLGADHMDKRAKLLAADSQYRRAKRVEERRLTASGKDRQEYDEWFGPKVWVGTFPPNIGKEDKALARHLELWSTEDLQLFLCGKQFEGFDGSVNDYCRNFRAMNVTGSVLAHTKGSRLAALLGIVGLPSKHRRIAKRALEEVIQHQRMVATPTFAAMMKEQAQEDGELKKLQASGQGHKRPAQQANRMLPVALGTSNDFKFIGMIKVTRSTGFQEAWTRIVESMELASALKDASSHEETQGRGFWMCSSTGDRLCHMSTDITPPPSEAAGNGHPGDLRRKLSSRESEHRQRQLDARQSVYEECSPILFLLPDAKETLRGVPWTGVKMMRTWQRPSDLSAKEDAWKRAHRLHIEGYEAKRRWAEQEFKEKQDELKRQAGKVKEEGGHTKSFNV